jgi:hypothetical protein
MPDRHLDFVYQLDGDVTEIDVFKELKNIPPVFFAPYGFKLIEVEGKKRWTPGTLEDYQRLMAKKLGVDPSEIKPKDFGHPICYNSSPTVCAGSCPGGESVCGGEADPVTGAVGCGCFA